MWVETEHGSVNLEYVNQMMVEIDNDMTGFQIGFWTSTAGYARSSQSYSTRKEAEDRIKELTDYSNTIEEARAFPKTHISLTRAEPEETPDEEDTQGEGPRRTD